MQRITKTPEYMLYRIMRLSIFFIFFSTVSVFAQVNKPVIKATVLQGEEIQGVQLFSLVPNIGIIAPFTKDVTGGGFNAIIGQPNWLKLRYKAPEDFVGTDRAVFECSETLFGPKSYVTVEVQVVRSILKANADYRQMADNESTILIDVRANDESSTGTFEVIGSENVLGGQTEILSDGRIKFVASENFSGLASFNYLIRDDKGTTASGEVFVNIISNVLASTDTLYFTHVSSEDLIITLPSEGFALSEDYSVLFGTLENNSPYSLQYRPSTYSEGLEFFLLENPAGLKRFVEISLIKNLEIQDITVDDVAFTSKGQYVIIDALANDYNKNVTVVDYSPGLIYTSGIFTYLPDANFTGVKQFYYTVHDGTRSFTGNIDIYIGDFLPQFTQYSFVTKKNSPIVLEYNIPIKNFSFSIVEGPANGDLRVNQSVVTSECNAVTSGYKMISYNPTSGFVGEDHFKIKYCINGGSCKTVSASVVVTDVDDICPCIGLDCVWAGDVNRDGIVNVADVLPLGYHYGESGNSRQQQGQNWGAEYADDWFATQIKDGINAKHVDTNGDGIISVNDTAAILANYNNFDNLVPSAVLIDKKIPLRFEVSNTSPDLGDAISIDIYVGSDQNPAVDLHGIALSVRVPTFLMDSSSELIFSPDLSWIGQNSPVLGVSHLAERGRLDLAMSRTIDIGVSGDGKIGTVSLTISETIDGLRPEDDELPVDIIIPSSFMTDGSGKQYQLEGGTVRLNYQLGRGDAQSDIISDQIDVLAYPNPSGGQISFHANNNDELISLSIYNSIGQLVHTNPSIKSNHLDVNVILPNGIYIAHLTTRKGIDVKKIEIVR